MTDQVLEQRVADPLAKFFQTHWRALAWTLALAAFAFYGFNTFKETRQQSLERSANLYATMRAEFEALKFQDVQLAELVKKPELDSKKDGEYQFRLMEAKTKLAATQTKLKEVLLSLKDGMEPYASFAELYQAELFARENGGSLKEFENLKDKFNPQGGVDQRMSFELLKFRLASGYLDSSQTRAQGLGLLSELASSGEFLNVVSAKRLATLAADSSEIQLALDALNSVAAKRLESRDALDKEIERLQAK